MTGTKANSSSQRNLMHFLSALSFSNSLIIWLMNLARNLIRKDQNNYAEKLQYYRLLMISVGSIIWVNFKASDITGHEVFLHHAFMKTCLVTTVSIDFWWPLRIKTTHPSERSASYHLCICEYPHITPHKCILQLKIFEGVNKYQGFAFAKVTHLFKKVKHHQV